MLIEVADDGRGFDPVAATTGLGLVSMRERAERLGGELTITPSTEAGTVVRAVVHGCCTATDGGPVGTSREGRRGRAGQRGRARRGGRPIRVFVVDDHEVVRLGLRAFLDVVPDIEIVGDAADGPGGAGSSSTAWPAGTGRPTSCSWTW